jgi:hypothetical protein
VRAAVALRGARVWPFVVVAVAACGSTSRHDDGDKPADAAAGAGAEVGSSEAGGGAGQLPEPVAGSSAVSGGTGGGATVPSAAGDGDGPLRDGRKLCQSPLDCLDLECIGFPPAATNVCSRPCGEAARCTLGEICFGFEALQPVCLQPCQGVEDCAYGFDCVHYEAQATVCLPASWAEIFMHPMTPS